MTYSERLERIELFRNATEAQRGWKSQIPDLAIQMIDYIKGVSTSLPNILIPTWGFNNIGGILNIFAPILEWDEFDFRIFDIITMPNYWYNPSSTSSRDQYFGKYFFENYLSNQLSKYPEIAFQVILKKWNELELNEKELTNRIINNIDISEWYSATNTLSALGRYMLNKSKTDIEGLYQYFPQKKQHTFLEFLLSHSNDVSTEVIDLFTEIKKDNLGLKEVSVRSILVLLQNNPSKYESLINKIIPQIESAKCILQLFFLLRKFYPAKYGSDLINHTYQFLNKVKYEMKIQGMSFHGMYSYESFIVPYVSGQKGLLYQSIELIIKDTPDIAFQEVVELSEICKTYNVKTSIFFEALPYYKEKLLPVIFSENNTIPFTDWNAENYYSSILRLIQTTNYQEYEPKVWEFTKSKSKKIRELAAVALSKLGEKSIPNAEKLLSEKKADARQTGALILSLIRTDKSQEILMNAIDSEKDDNTRDTMLEGVADQLPTVFSQEEILQKVQKAKERNKLEKPLEWWLDESKLPPVYWQNSNQIIDNETIRFLFYRMSRTKDIRTDIEAKPLILSIDRTTSGNFAKSLIKTYFDNGADAKYKFCLTLSGLLGDDDIIDLMKRKVNEFAEGSRGKMAEYTVKALALQGSTKALRAVEFFSRKYKNKNKNIGAAANESFGIAAEELGITPYDLADSIIPNFDFDGLFREFEAGGENYRAFINTDFKIAYFNEDNKLMKSPPKAISKELAEEFKEISKEIRDIVKSQSGRLEQYLVIQRKWNAEKWQEFFLGNPIMFAYAVRLIWGAYNAKGELQFVFRCEQDQTLIDENSDEIEIQEDLFVGMVHPISLTSESIEYWNTSLYDANIEAIFPQLKRPVVLLKEGDKNLRISEEFTGIKISGYTFVGKLEKMGWFRGSVVDGGGIASYYKDFSELGITAVVLQIGSIGVGYLEDNAEVGSIMFAKKGSVKFGSYMYDEPDKTTDSRLFAFGEVPPIVYSEVLADMMALKAIAITT